MMDRRCPRHLRKLPQKSCPYGENKAKSMMGTRNRVEQVQTKECVWYLNDPNSCFCFFKYMRNPENYGKSLTLREIADLYNTSINNIKLREQEAFTNFLELLNLEEPDLAGAFQQTFEAETAI